MTVLMPRARVPVAAFSIFLAITSVAFGHDAASVRLAPDGEYIAALVANESGARNLVTMRLSDNRARAITGYTDSDVSNFFWANDERLVFAVDKAASNEGGTRQYGGSYTILRDGSGGRKLQEKRARPRSPELSSGGSSPQLLHRLPTRWNEVLVSWIIAPRIFPEVFLLDVDTGRSRRVVAAEYQITRWIADNSGAVRAAIDKGDDVLDGNQRLLYRDREDSPWREVVPFKDGELEVLGFHADNRRLVVLAAGDRARGLYLMDAAGTLRESLLTDPETGLTGSTESVGLKQTSQGHLVFYQYGTGDIKTVYFDSRWESRQTAIDEALADTTNTVVDWSDDERQLLVHARDRQGGGDYYLFDTTYRELKFLQPPASWLKSR